MDRSPNNSQIMRTVNPEQAEAVRRVFRDFAASISPRAIARRLDDEGVPGPDGALWADSTLRASFVTRAAEQAANPPRQPS